MPRVTSSGVFIYFVVNGHMSPERSESAITIPKIMIIGIVIYLLLSR